MDRPIPRWSHPELGELALRYFIFLRFTEEIFAGELYGDDAAHVLHHEVFYRHGGESYTETDQLTHQLRKKTVQYLKVALGVQEWRHYAVAMGRRFMMGVMDPEDEFTTVMDAHQGHGGGISARIYALQPGQIGTLNEHTMALFLACARLCE